MKLSQTKAELYWDPVTEKHLEHCGRLCYDSFNRTTETSAIPFLEDKVKLGHWAVLEHAGIDTTVNMPYLDKLKEDSPEFGLVMARAVLGGIRYSDLIKYSSKYDTFEKAINDKNLKRDSYLYSFDIHCSRYISQQFERHRNLSYVERSLRFCKMTKDKFGVVIPGAIKDPELLKKMEVHIEQSIDLYSYLCEQKCRKDDARSVLPLCTETRLIVTGQITWWLDFLIKRYTTVASHEMIKLCRDIYTQLPDTVKDIFNKEHKEQKEAADECIKDE